jgi:hypothetical protein
MVDRRSLSTSDSSRQITAFEYSGSSVQLSSPVPPAGSAGRNTAKIVDVRRYHGQVAYDYARTNLVVHNGVHPRLA